MIICSAISAFAISGQSQKNNEILDANIEALAYEEMPGESENCETADGQCYYHNDHTNYNIEREKNK